MSKFKVCDRIRYLPDDDTCVIKHIEWDGNSNARYYGQWKRNNRYLFVFGENAVLDDDYILDLKLREI